MNSNKPRHFIQSHFSAKRFTIYQVLMLLMLGIGLNGGARAQSANDGFPHLNLNGTVYAIAVQSNGFITIGGTFTSVQGQARNRIARLAPDGTLTSFNASLSHNTPSVAAVYALVVQPDDKILVGGNFTMIGGQTRHGVARLNADGTVDTGFNIPQSTTSSGVYALALQADGKILVGGSFGSLGGQSRDNLGRVNANGTLDTSFANPGATADVRTIVVQADGKIVVGGDFNHIGGQARQRLARFNADGTLDASFNPGIGHPANPNASIYVAKLALQADGKILVCGFFTTLGGQTHNKIGRLHPDGTPDGNFNANIGGGNQPTTMAVQPDGKILVANGHIVNGQIRRGLARLNLDGTLDTGFNPPMNVDSLEINAIAVQADGKVLVGHGLQLTPSVAGFGRVYPDGGLDTTFNPGVTGVVLTMALQPDGKLVIGGAFSAVAGQTRNNLARLNSDGSLDATFNPGTNAHVYALAIQPDGKIVVGGAFSGLGGGDGSAETHNYLGRINPDGTVDSSFSTGAEFWVYTLAVQTDSKILVGGVFNALGSVPRQKLGRLNSDGSLDFGFDPGANEAVYALTVQSDDKILVGGSFTSLGGGCFPFCSQTRNRLGRLLADGQVDTDFDPGANETVYAITLQADGKILVGGGFTGLGLSTGAFTHNRLGRLNLDGSVDQTFNPSANSEVYALAMQADGRIFVGGIFTSLNNNTRNRLGFLSANGGLEAYDPVVGVTVNGGGVYCLALQLDGKLLVGGEFGAIGGAAQLTRSSLARLLNTQAATQSLQVTSSSLTWTRSLASPEIDRVTFESSLDGLNWTNLGNGTRSSNTWQVTGLSFPTGQNMLIRARGWQAASGYFGEGSVYQAERIAFFPASWQGTSPDWHAASNWGGTLPDASATVTLPATGVASEAVISSADVTLGGLSLGSGRTLTVNAGRTLTINGDAVITGALVIQGTLICNGTLTFNGSAPQTVPANATINHLVSNNAAGVTLGGNVTVSGALTLTTDLNAGSYTLSQTLDAPCGSGAGDVVGNYKRLGLVGSQPTCFGNANNQITVDGSSIPTQFTVNLVKSPSTLSNSVARLYTLTPANGPGDYVATVRLRYLDSEVGGLDESQLRLWRYNSATSMWEDKGGVADPSNNYVEVANIEQFSPWAIGGPSAPTAVTLMEFAAAAKSGGGVTVQWRTGYEADTVGFNLYRAVGSERLKLTPGMVAGSALLAAGRTVLTAGNGYQWTDAGGAAGSGYWLEEVDLSGTRTWYGPVYAGSSFGVGADATLRQEEADAPLLDALNGRANRTTQVEQVAADKPERAGVGERGSVGDGALGRVPVAAVAPWTLPNQVAAKLAVKKDGWYRVTAAELQAVGFNTKLNPALLQLFADGVEVPLRTTGAGNSLSSLEFYGRGLATPTDDARVYWLITANVAGLRWPVQAGAAVQAVNTTSFLTTVERQDKLIYFSGLLNGEAENWFGPIVTQSGATQTLTTRFVQGSAPATLEVTLQGVTEQLHAVNIELNGQYVGTLNFSGKQRQATQFTLAANRVLEGANEIRCTSLVNGSDINLIERVRLTYARGFVADNDALSFRLNAGQSALISGFSTPQIRLLELAANGEPARELTVTAAPVNGHAGGSYGFTWQSAAGASYLAVNDAQLARAASVTLNARSDWRAATNGAQFIILTHRAFWAAAQRLATARRAQNLNVAVVDVEDVYDEFSFGAKSPQAVKDLLITARTIWAIKPKFALLIGDTTTDPRDYLGLGNADFVPTRLGVTTYFETALDNWLADADGDGLPELALGRLPVRTAVQADALVTKLLAFTPSATAPRPALLVSDRTVDGVNFQTQSQQYAAALLPQMSKQFINRNDGAPEQVRAQILKTINADKPLVVNWSGHGSTQVWTGDGLLRTQDAVGLTNTAPSLFVMTTCLNGYFLDPTQTSLSEAVLLNTPGGAFAVVASSALNTPQPQYAFNLALYQGLFGQGLTLGEALSAARQAVGDKDVRNSYVLLGDPTLKLR